MSRFTIAEPHPTVGQNAYAHSGRGGAGNYFRTSSTTTAAATSTSIGTPTPPRSSSNFYSGRGGAGNAHVSATRPVMSFDEELARKSQLEEKRVGYVGRGGAGNIFDTTPTPGRKDDDGASASSSRSSSSFRERVSSVFGRR